MSVKLLTKHHLEFLSLKVAAQARLSLHLSKCHIDGNHMSRLIFRADEQTKMATRIKMPGADLEGIEWLKKKCITSFWSQYTFNIQYPLALRATSLTVIFDKHYHYFSISFCTSSPYLPLFNILSCQTHSINRIKTACINLREDNIPKRIRAKKAIIISPGRTRHRLKSAFCLS